MRSKRLQEFANNLCHMLVGWRMYEDLQVLAECNGGQLTIDLLAGKTIHASRGELNLHITQEMQAWLEEQMQNSKIDASKITKASISAKILSIKLVTTRKRVIRFEFDIHSMINTDETSYSGYLKENHEWHQRFRR